jgi:acetyl/propionyl-CoA carboxylase alpha subunit
MRVVNAESELGEAIESARREALHAFGDERLLIEKYLADAHHIEVQIFGDRYGNLVHLFERECSIQRRHQKIIEESPSPLLTSKIRMEMGEAAVAAAKAVGYYNAGTVEFIFDAESSKYYFLEMNTRLQVEHPVTELVAGIDLVQWQIRVADGEKFPLKQKNLTQRGHAIECRVYAEDPSNGFLPSTGRLLQYIEPHGPGIRVDSGFAKGDQVSHYYDPLLAKLITHAEDRESAIRKMQAALCEFIVHGVITNIDFMQSVLAHEDFAKGRVTTRWVEKIMESASLHAHEGTLAYSQELAPALHGIAAALADMVMAGTKPQSAVSNETDPFSPWRQTGNYRN